MERNISKLAVALATIAFLLPGLLLISNIPTSSAAAPNDIGRVTVSGPDILVDGKVPDHPFFGVCDTTALAFAIQTYIDGNRNVAGWTSVFNAPDTGSHVPVTPNDTPDAFWNQYFAQMEYYGVNLVRIGAGDTWGTEHQYDAWENHREEYFDLLHTMSYYAQAHGVWLAFVVAGAQEYPTYHYGGSGSVFDPSSSAYANYIEYSKSTMVELEKENAIAMYDLFNEPDHNNIHAQYWHGDKVRFNQWSNAVADDTAGVSDHPRTMGVAGFGNMFGMNKADFDLATGDTGFEILHRHYYGSNTDPSNFAGPEQWARAAGKPLFWGELANNGPYPLVRYDYGEDAIWNAGGKAIASMVLTGTPGYPYYGGVSGSASVPMPNNWKGSYSGSDDASLALDITSSPSLKDKVGNAYEYKVLTNTPASIRIDTDASFLALDRSGSTLRGTPGMAGNYTIKVISTANGQEDVQEYTLSVAGDPERGSATISAEEIAPREYRFSFEAELAGDTVSRVQWDFGDGSVSNEISPSHAFADGDQLVTLSLYGENGTMLNTTYSLDFGEPSSDVPGSGQSIAGAVGWGTTNSMLMVVGLVCASVVGLVGYYGMGRGTKFSSRRKTVTISEVRSARELAFTTVKLIREMNLPDRKLMRDLSLYLLGLAKARGFGLIALVRDQTMDSVRIVKDAVVAHLRRK
ncbi:MAG: PKD domain-containing protein [Methanomassiliicoccus sp.]|nr:PKD domain-containing protein [Methanomassiliicoccus sp.]